MSDDTKLSDEIAPEVSEFPAHVPEFIDHRNDDEKTPEFAASLVRGFGQTDSGQILSTEQIQQKILEGQEFSTKGIE